MEGLIDMYETIVYSILIGGSIILIVVSLIIIALGIKDELDIEWDRFYKEKYKK